MLIRRGIEVLMTHERTLYSQRLISEKLAAVGQPASTALLSRLKNGGTATKKFLVSISSGLCLIIASEIGMHFDYEKETFVESNEKGWVPALIGEVPTTQAMPPFVFHAGGRRSIAEKTAFIANARREVIFLGLRMRQFANYFTARRDGEFADHIEKLLIRGVNVKCYLLDFTSNRAKLYFQDLAEVLPEEENGELEIKVVLDRLLVLKQYFDQQHYAGTFSLRTYRHLPSAHYLIVDGAAADGKMHVSHYLFGQPSAKVPVLEVWRARSAKLYDLYWASAERLMSGASTV